MAGGFSSLEIARSGLFVNERGLQVTSHNISNVNTPGYARQQAMITTGPHDNLYGIGQVGLGADIGQVRQIRHTFIDNIYRQESNSLGYWEARGKTFEEIQAILGEPFGSGVQSVLNQFWDSWQELSKAPDSLTARSLVRQRGEGLVQHMNHVGLQLDKLQGDLNSEFKVRIDEVNEITKTIGQLNLKIASVEVTRDAANDLRDQRNVLLDRLSNLINIDTFENADGQVDVTTSGHYLVSKGGKNTPLLAELQDGGLFYIAKIAETDMEVNFKSGTVKGLLESRGEVIGAKDSILNGSPNVKADVVFVIDVSSSAGYLNNVKSSIGKYVDELEKRGVDYNLRLVTYGDNAAANNNYGSDKTSFINDVNSLLPSADIGNNFSSVVAELDGITDFRANANRYALVFTNESIGGNEIAETDADVQSYVDTLSGKNIKTSVITDDIYFNGGAPAGETSGWDSITDGTGGKVYDVNSSDYNDLMGNIAKDISTDVNDNISVISESKNIVSGLKRKLNAMFNIMVREINYWHKQGKTLGTNQVDGEDFFAAIDGNYPLQMGNIKLNDNLKDLDRIVASYSGAVGDNTIAQKIANLRNEAFISGEKSVLDIDTYYQKIILSVGNEGSEAINISKNQSKLVQSAEGLRQSIMGVSMDEELSNMMKYKFAYSASSRFMNVVDGMLETIITRLGLVGR